MELPRKVIELQRLRSRLRLDAASLLELRERKLRSLVDHAWRNVDYYRRLFDGAGVDPASIRTLADLERIPVTTKEDLRQAGPRVILARGTDPSACNRYLTSGTSGKALVVLTSPAEARTRLLVELRGLRATGLLKAGERLAILGPVHWGPGHLYQRLGLFRRDYVSPQLSVNDQIARLEALRPDILWAYPSLLMAIVERLGGRLSRAVRPRALVTSAEEIPGQLEASVRADLDVAWFNFYGSAETGRIAWECPAHEGLHLNADTLVLELVPDGTGATRTVVTALDSRMMPILRYDLGDVTTEVGGACPCGVTFPRIHSPQGRIVGLVRLPDGRSVSSWSLRSIVRDHPGVDQYRLHQKRPDHLVLHLVTRGSPSDVPALENRLRDRLGPSVRLEVLAGPTMPPGPPATFVSDL
ncbi:MAG: phenylacetate--CoA ligase family protein [Gemmatimonadota bacterium]